MSGPGRYARARTPKKRSTVLERRVRLMHEAAIDNVARFQKLVDGHVVLKTRVDSWDEDRRIAKAAIASVTEEVDQAHKLLGDVTENAVRAEVLGNARAARVDHLQSDMETLAKRQDEAEARVNVANDASRRLGECVDALNTLRTRLAETENRLLVRKLDNDPRYAVTIHNGSGGIVNVGDP